MDKIIASARDFKTQVNTAANQTGASTDVNVAVGVTLNVVFSIVAIVAVVMIVIGGISITTSQGDSNKVKKGKQTITFGIIGMVVSIFAFAIVNFVLKSV